MLAEERRQRILEIIARDGKVIAKDLAAKFEMSLDSIRRDLSIMEEQGLLQKTYGGAILPEPTPKVRTMSQPDAIRYGAGAPHENAISKLAASCIKKNDTVFIGGAGIHYGMMKYLPTDFPYTIITNSLKIAEHIRTRENISSYLIGGKLRGVSSGSMIDCLAMEMMRKFSLDICFLTGGGINVKGISTSTPEAAAFAQTVSSVAHKVVCLAPHEKIGLEMFMQSIPMEEIDILITDLGAPEKIIQEIKKKRTQIIFADLH
ncbi:DeoR/GlpR transcriptional regulator [Cytobacillus oceanisediminis]|uniref:DeoR/GlpR family DNA-binding transcription regulator n=1 Tax=Bacillaceae TaxID=186817 RepID=UPI001CC981D9|nr:MULTISPECIES: DeoR/GlpR family DNA-binding transcription regulator [Bacillaceae]MBQ6448311.1 DeoR/GlpR transcriptional regulator [Bacillus sp. (in: firmicutes)]MBZ9535160.1 DeoR/GlpR transcriptional regulator [Cytobacillus oceanisediminis]UTI41211.1 DeoR/GlpR family DNA-binding transcription regulator [Niallia sp. RD1]